MAKSDVRDYDVVVIGSGSGAAIVESAMDEGLSVALVDRGPLGGTCLNVGCIPTKVLTTPADRVMEIQESRKLGLDARLEKVDFQAIMERMRRIVREGQEEMRHALSHAEGVDFYEVEAHFVGERTLQVGKTTIRGKKVFISAGARPLIPAVRGLDAIPYLTNESVLQLVERPASLAIIGGSYIGCEFAHFFAAMGTQVTILQRNQRLVPEEEPVIASLLAKKLSERMAVHTRTEVTEVRPAPEGYTVVARDGATGQALEVTAEQVLVAAGRQSNADLLQVEKTGVHTDERGYIQANPYLETNVKGIWAFGDITGRHMFRHVANREAVYAWHNSQHDHKVAMDYRAIPHAVFTWPQIAAVGLTQEEAQEKHDVLVGYARYMDVAKGEAMMETEGFAKAIVDRKTGRILGFHIVGPEASILIQEVINAMAGSGEMNAVSAGLHIHPALPELVMHALYSLREPE